MAKNQERIKDLNIGRFHKMESKPRFQIESDFERWNRKKYCFQKLYDFIGLIENLS